MFEIIKDVLELIFFSGLFLFLTIMAYALLLGWLVRDEITEFLSQQKVLTTIYFFYLFGFIYVRFTETSCPKILCWLFYFIN